jgi:hypothetical protein
MTKNNCYQGGDIEIIVAFLSGKHIQFIKGDTWVDIPLYDGNPIDVYRVSKPSLTFRIAPKIKELFILTSSIEKAPTTVPLFQLKLKILYSNNS